MKLIYFLYLLKNTKFKKLFSFIQYVKKLQNRSIFSIFSRMSYCFRRYNTAFLDYFFLEFYNKTEIEIATYSDTLFMYKFQNKVNDKNLASSFRDKKKFYKLFKHHVHHPFFLPGPDNIEDFTNWIALHKPENIIVKYSKGQVGKGLKKIRVKEKEGSYFFEDLDLAVFYKELLQQKLDILEVNIEQHPLLKSFHPNSLNTIRVITVLDSNGKVVILGTILRIGVENNVIDNFDAGGVSAVVNLESGVVEGPLLYKDPRKKIKKTSVHPTTNVKILGTVLPFWKELIDLVQELALVVPEVRTVGWDIAITEKGPLLLEGNNNWDKTHWQKSYGKGMKSILNSHQ